MTRRIFAQALHLHEAKIAEIGVLSQFDRLVRPHRDAGIAIIGGTAGAGILLILISTFRVCMTVNVSVATAGMVVPLATAQRDLIGLEWPLQKVMRATVHQPEMTRSGKDHGQNRHQTDSTEGPAPRSSVSGEPG